MDIRGGMSRDLLNGASGFPLCLFLSGRATCPLAESFAHWQKCSHFLLYFFRHSQAFRVMYCAVLLPGSVSRGNLGAMAGWGCAPLSCVWFCSSKCGVTRPEEKSGAEFLTVQTCHHLGTIPLTTELTSYGISHSSCLLKKENPQS